MRCPHCQAEYPNDLTLCPVDGRRLLDVKDATLVGTILDDKYQLLECLGSGGMGSVYKAHLVSNDKLVAIKIRHKTDAPKTELDRFQREAQAAALVTHPNIVAIYDSGVTVTGIHYLVMELLEGPSLAAELAQTGPFSVEHALAVLRPVALALASLHARGLIHRDVKPSNVILHRPNPGIEIVKVVDFGMARMDRLPHHHPELSTGWILGTPEYMSPEQCLGHTADARADLYSFGITLYELLTGKLPFQDLSYSNILLKQVSEHPPYLRQARPDLPASLEAFILRLLSKLPENRPSGMIEMLEEFESICRKWILDSRRFAPISPEAALELLRSEGSSQLFEPFTSQNAPTLVATLMDIPTAWELDERETLSGCYLRSAFVKKLQKLLAEKTETSVDFPLGCLLVLELVGWEVWRTTAKVEEVEYALQQVGALLKQVFGPSTLLGRQSESRWLVALPASDSKNQESQNSSPLIPKSKVLNLARKRVLEFHRNIQAHHLLGKKGRLMVRGGGILYRYGDVVETLSNIALERLQRVRKNERELLVLGDEPGSTTPLSLSDASLPALQPTGALPPLPLEEPTLPRGLLSKFSFIGRQSEVERLRSAFYQSLRGNAFPGWVLGEAGSGKTQLLEHLREQMSTKDVSFISGKFHSVGGTGPLQVFYDSLREVLLQLFEESPDSLSATFGTMADRVRSDFLAEKGGTGSLFKPSPTPPLVQEDSQKLTQFDYLTRIFTMLARTRPLFLCLDDMQWASAFSLEFLSYLLRNTAKERLFLLCTFRRPDIDRIDHPVKLWLRQMQRMFPGETIHLPPLTLQETRLLLEAMFDHARVSEYLVHQLFHETLGNPFHLTQLVPMLVKEAHISWNGIEWQMPESETIPLPPSVRDLAETLLTSLDSEELDVFSLAALIGETFSFELLSKLTGLRESVLSAVLDSGVEQSLILEDDSVQDGYRFQLPFVRRALCEHLSSRRRKKLHHQIFESIEQLYPGRTIWSSTLAFHTNCLQNWPAIWQHASRAGRIAQRSPQALALVEARRFYEWAYQALKKMEKGEWRKQNEEFSRKQEEKKTSAEILDSPSSNLNSTSGSFRFSIEESRLRVRFHLDYSSVLQSIGLLNQAAVQVAEAQDVAEKLGADDLLAHTFLARGKLFEDQGDIPSALSTAYQGLALLMQIEDKGGVLVALLLLASLNQRSGHYQKALDQYTQALQRAKESDNSNAQAQALWGMAVTYRSQGNYTLALETANQSLRLSQRERGQREMVEVQKARSLMGNLYLDMGLLKQAGEYLGLALASAQKGCYRLNEAQLLLSLSRLHLEVSTQNQETKNLTGSLSGAASPITHLALSFEYLNQAQHLALQLGDTETYARTLITSGYLLARQGKLRVALETLQQALSLLREKERPVLEVETYLALGEIRYQLGQFAAGIYERALSLAQEIGHRRTQLKALYGLSVIAGEQGDTTKQRKYLDQAKEVLTAMMADLPDDLKSIAFWREREFLSENS